MSHHLDCEIARRDNRLDITDLFVFPGETGTVLVMDVNSSLAGPDARPGFHPEARYEFKIHMDDATVEELTYRVTFGERDERGEQAVALHVLTGSDASDDTATGDLLAEGRTDSPISGPDGLRLWAGRARDPFYVDLTQVRAINAAVRNGARIELPGWGPNAAKSSFAGSTIHAIVLEIADRDPRLSADRRIGVWVTTKLATDAAAGGRSTGRAIRWCGRSSVPMTASTPATRTRFIPPTRWTARVSTSRGSSRGSSPRTAPTTIPSPTARRWPGACCPTCCLTVRAPRPSSDSPNTTVVPSLATRPR
ncbi:DUF4331 family protein [Streptosporangium lutulentum]